MYEITDRNVKFVKAGNFKQKMSHFPIFLCFSLQVFCNLLVIEDRYFNTGQAEFFLQFSLSEENDSLCCQATIGLPELTVLRHWFLFRIFSDFLVK
jgi:hypothetical protein